MEDIDIGFRIKQLREQKNLSQEQLANLLEISQSKLSKIENGRLKKIEMKLVLKFCKNIDIELDEFFENKDTVDANQ
jgi:transcriptional regulator with XRE-family HTH domain